MDLLLHDFLHEETTVLSGNNAISSVSFSQRGYKIIQSTRLQDHSVNEATRSFSQRGYKIIQSTRLQDHSVLYVLGCVLMLLYTVYHTVVCRLSPAQLVAMATDVASGLSYMESMSYVHK